MLESIVEFLGGVARSIRIADIFDVVLMTFFLYAFITGVRQGTSRSAAHRVLIVALIFSTVYLLARFFDMILVEGLLQVLFLIALLVIVVVFQSEVRRMLDRLASWRIFRHSPIRTGSSSHVIDMLVESVSRLAEGRTGALIALKGREPWDDHIHGGVRLDGEVSQPLLYSLFNPDTPGHDGAVLLEGKRITRFAAHLPLARTLPEASRYGGTRHAAALGLAEHSDALVIVASEETGKISVAEGGRIQEIPSASDLKHRLELFWERQYAQPTVRVLDGAFRRHMQTALASAGLALLLWLLFAYSPTTVYRTFEVPIAFRNLPPGWELVQAQPRTALVTLASSEQAFRLLNPENLVISFDLSDPEEGQYDLDLGIDNLRLPSRVDLYDVEPEEVSVVTRRMVSLTLPVEVRHTGTLPDSLVLRGLYPEPDSIQLLVPATNQRRPSAVYTEPVDLGEITASGQVEGRLDLRDTWRLAQGQSAEIPVNVEVAERSPDL